MKEPLPPFSITYTPSISELLNDLNISLVLSTYQAGKVITISAPERDRLMQLPRTFSTAMGIALHEDKMAVASKNELVVLKNSKQLAATYPNKKDTYDALYLPRATYYTGQLALHDMVWINGKLVATNTLFSCLSEINDDFSFTPVWKPPFISQLVPEDRCHLNGIASVDNKIEFVTALGTTDKASGWRDNKMNGGMLMHAKSGEIIVNNLSMPHSPRIFNKTLYVLNSAQGELLEVDPKTKKTNLVCKLGGFARGMDKFGDYLFIGVSKLRHNTSSFRDLPIAKSSFAGIVIVYLPMKAVIGQIKYETSVEEIYDVKVLKDTIRPNILNTEKEIHQLALHIPETTFWAKPEEKEHAK
jgi:uncharacterized protein (TIGR03032 family)